MTHDNLGKYVSFILRHSPDSIGIRMDQAGFVNVEQLVKLSVVKKKHFTIDEIKEMVRLDEKGRFELNEVDNKGLQIRCVQGHSLDWVDVGLVSESPPEYLYHGTNTAVESEVRRLGIHSGRRLHVHMSEDVETALEVGRRKGDPVTITIKAGEMHRAGLVFYKAKNGVWLTDFVPNFFLM